MSSAYQDTFVSLNTFQKYFIPLMLWFQDYKISLWGDKKKKENYSMKSYCNTKPSKQQF